MNKKFFYENYQWIMIIIWFMIVALFGFYLGNHHANKKDSYTNNAAYEQQKQACLTSKVKCNPIAQTAN